MVDRKTNNFSSLRLLFASAVIFSHSATVLTGNSLLEPQFGIDTLGSLAVDGFFIVSGYLITKSFDNNRDIGQFLQKRILRIYPGFLVNMSICLFVLAPIVTINYHPNILWLLRLLILSGPRTGAEFADMPMSGLNGPIWTLAYEFRCYLLVAVLGLLGFQKLRVAILCVAVIFLAASGLAHLPEASGAVYVILGSPPQIARLFGMFAVGMSFYLWRERIAYNLVIATVAVCILATAPLFPSIANIPLAVGGGYLIFWAALSLPTFRLSRWSNETDLSYGIYLYAWPIQMTVAYIVHRAISPWMLSCVSLVLAATAAYISWKVVERPAMGFRRAPSMQAFLQDAAQSSAVRRNNR